MIYLTTMSQHAPLAAGLVLLGVLLIAAGLAFLILKDRP